MAAAVGAADVQWWDILTRARHRDVRARAWRPAHRPGKHRRGRPATARHAARPARPAARGVVDIPLGEATAVTPFWALRPWVRP
ncbi:hypothetical protein GCM10018962_77510 [Dactylosporangium matsuzakiense]|uniref:hypothetical protein n=1 Tax=Dactylosporangium matsuzakiense TaxID=53360 RepID=UPI0031E83012